MLYAYLLECGDGSYYCGSARSLDARLGQHAAGLGGDYTAKRQPVTLVWMEEFDRIDDAYAREKQIQGWSRAKRRALIDGRFDDLPALSARARRRSESTTRIEVVDILPRATCWRGLDKLDPPGARPAWGSTRLGARPPRTSADAVGAAA